MNNNNNHQHHLQQIHRQFITYGNTPVVPLSHAHLAGAPTQTIGMDVHSQAQQQNMNGSPTETMAPSMGFLGQPQTYMNFGVSSTGAPMGGQLALVLIPPGLNPSAAVAASCQLLMLGCVPTAAPDLSQSHFSTPVTSFLNMSFNPQHIHGSMNTTHTLIHQPHQASASVIPEGFQSFQYITAPPPPPTTNTSTPGNLNPHAEAFVPTNSSMRSFVNGSSRREKGGGDTHQQVNGPVSGKGSAYNARNWRSRSGKSSCPVSVDNWDENGKTDSSGNPDDNVNVSAGSGEPDFVERVQEMDCASGIGKSLTALKVLDENENSMSEQMTFSEGVGFIDSSLIPEEQERSSTETHHNYQEQNTPRHYGKPAGKGRRGP